MLEGFTRGEALLNKIVVIGALLLVILLILMMVRIKNRNAVVLKGGFILDQTVLFYPKKEMVFSVGPKVLSDNHIHMVIGSSFQFIVTAERSNSGDRYITIRCDPPGLLKHRGEIKTKVDLYSGDTFEINNVPIVYSDGKELTVHEDRRSKNILEGRI